MTRRSALVVAVVTWSAGLLAGADVTSAHELGQTRALASFTADGRYAIEILVDPQALLAQLALDAGGTPSSESRAEVLVPLVISSADRITAGIEVLFDGRPATPAFAYETAVPPALAINLTSSSPADIGTIRLTGVVPEGARRFSFAYRWTFGATALMVHDFRSRDPRTLWVGRAERSPEVALDEVVAQTWAEVARDYVVLGFTHILPKGLDHILFVLGLFFLSAGWRPLLIQVSTFTVAHTITLGLSMLGVVALSPAIVEPLIALSIAYVALENLATTELRPTRLVLIFGFGLLHGMGFAGVLTELGVPASQFFTALLAFNGGVELGQLAVIAMATVAVAGWRRREASLMPLVARPASVVIAISGLYWMVERLLAG